MIPRFPATEPAAHPPQPVKRMRRGTRSCRECRQRKIRCTFAPGAQVCGPCSIRGTTCLEQGTSGSSPLSEAREQRGQSQHCQQTRHETHNAEMELERDDEDRSADLRVLSTGLSQQPPFLAAISFSEPSVAETSTPMSGPLGSSASNTPFSSARVENGRERAARACKVLRSNLPSYDDLLTVLEGGANWWNSFRRKTQIISQAHPIESLTAFAARAYTSSTPAEVGTLAVAYARSTGSNTRLYSLVDDVILSDFRLAATLAGLECLVLVAKTYTDIGQPRRAWLTWRKGMMMAQIMGIYRQSPEKATPFQRIWWAIYHGDRFTSLLLGLPSGFSDTFYESEVPTLPTATDDENVWVGQFVHQCAIEAGKVIDRNIRQGAFVADTRVLSARVAKLKSLAPEAWWNLPTRLPSAGPELDQLVDRLLIQFFFYHIEMYTHLPNMAANKGGHLRMPDVGGHSCAPAARELLRRFLLLRSRVHGVYLFDCKTSDFVGFTAAVVLLLANSAQPSRSSTEDAGLIGEAVTVFRQLEGAMGCTIAGQCHRALQVLSSWSNGGQQHDSTAEESIQIPYFGKIVRRPSARPASISLPASAYEFLEADPEPCNLEFLAYGSPEVDLFSSTEQEEAMDGSSTYGASFWMDPALLDIGQDWTLFPSPHEF
ncbi:uncharacterized protein B0I36DRAFT_270479 [Microdochium trichocladiopsis]|uniref:Zn(2)-C6 fungal-type domain-containing protein n=1 Tax=Microdochium trichocladiopsis TaxID=1682393 RepID=A0A9P8Y7X1_9PEZI|nr:uncharacterized protein B0I36DRAFT_270479 [Microdochium trichocladiopsis]KAH7029811.1 hypothetical protein B0I36DRAFT_270479 [Microdochium trichocladiopsis]